MAADALVMGSASNLHAGHFTPFLRSFEACGTAARVCVFVTRMEPGDVARLGELADEVIALDDSYPTVVPGWVVGGLRWVKTTRGLRRFYPAMCRFAARCLRAGPGSRRWRDLEYRLEGVQSLRYQHYLEHLLANPDVELVMISDLRDVVFQGDPFAGQLADLEVFLEEEHVRCSTPGFNSRWLRDLYGEEGLAALGDAVVSCSGVTIGSRDGMVGYLRAMVAEVGRHQVPLGAHDQGMHNWLLRTNQLGNVTVVANGTGRVQTMGEQREIYLDLDGRVLNPDGSVPPVIHQYDRHAGLAARLFARLGDE
jgi:hypothetical protein